MRALSKWSTDLRRQAVVLAFLGLAAISGRAAAQSGMFTPTGSMTYGRYTHTATQLRDGKVLVAGGNADAAELYDAASGTFTVTGSLVVARIQHAATLLPNGKVLITGGRDVLGSGLPSTFAAELYDPATGRFTATGNMISGRHSHTATLLSNGKVLVAGGFNWTTPLATAELYDPEAGTFASTGNSMATARATHAATLLPSGKVLIAGGEVMGPDGYFTTTAGAEVYDPAARRGGTFTPTGNLNVARMNLTGTLLPNGRVLIAGGAGSSAAVASGELYAEAAGTFTATGSLSQAREGPTATLLPNGKVLIAGGRGGYWGYGPEAELYDPAGGTFTPTANNISLPRAWTTATLLSTNGKVLIAGGYWEADKPGTPTADLYGDLQACY